VIYLDVEDLLHIAERTLGAPAELRDAGLLDSAAGRPAATAFGSDAYPTVHLKAAALLHSLAGNHPLVDGNKRLALVSTLVFLRLNGQRPLLTNGEAHDLLVAAASGELDDVDSIAARLERGTEPTG